MTSDQHEQVNSTIDQVIDETERKLDEQLTMIDVLGTDRKSTEYAIKELADLLDTLEWALEHKMLEQKALNLR